MQVMRNPIDRQHLVESYVILGGVFMMAAFAAALMAVIVVGMVFTSM